MPTDEQILGFSNRWYLSALRHAVWTEVGGGISIRLVTAPFFLATKLEAFYGRGQNDFMASHDLEDIIAVLDGRVEITKEVRSGPEEIQVFLKKVLTAFYEIQSFWTLCPATFPLTLPVRKELRL